MGKGGKRPTPTFYFSPFTSYFLSITFLIGLGRTASMELEEIGKGALIVKTEGIRDLAHGHIGRLEQVACFVVSEHREIIVHRVARKFAHNAAQISGRNVELVCIELDLALLSEVPTSQIEEDLQYLFLVPEVVCDKATVIGQLADKQQTDVDERADHLRFINMYVVDCFADLLKDAAQLGRAHFIKMVDKGGFRRDVLHGDVTIAPHREETFIELAFDEEPFGDRIPWKPAVDRLEGRECQQVTGAQVDLVFSDRHMCAPLSYQLHLIATDAVCEGPQIILSSLNG